MTTKQATKISIIVVGTLFCFLSLLYFIAGNAFFYSPIQDYPLSGEATGTIDLIQEVKVSQKVTVEGTLQKVDTMVTVDAAASPCNLTMEIYNAMGTLLLRKEQSMVAGYTGFVSFPLDKPIVISANEEITIHFFSNQTHANNLYLLFESNEQSNNVQINGLPHNSNLALRLGISRILWLGPCYWQLTGIAILAICAYLSYELYLIQHGRIGLFFRAVLVFNKYSFLLTQLIQRDFKTKYKRSILGVVWSLLSPLLTMIVQYIVFSTIFKNDIENFPVYLLIGIVWFGFFSECGALSISAITANANLINKVYVPKYIFPISRVISSLINLMLSIIPLFFVMLITSVNWKASLLLMPLAIVFIFAFCLGLSFFLSATMVFFRDVQFLWGIVSLLWMYATPIFYPENIIPEHLLWILKFNPLYHFIRFTRYIILNGASPEPKAYIYCFIFSFGMLFFGLMVFKKTQKKFALYL